MLNQRSTSLTDNRSPELIRAEEAEEIMKIKRAFWWFSVVASLNHALNYVVTSFATSVLDTNLGGVILGLLWSLNSVSGLTVATPIVRYFGFKWSMIIALWGYTFQIGSLYLAMICTDRTTTWVIAILGSVVAGFTSAVWWTAQGVCFEGYCQKIDACCAESFFGRETLVEHVRAELSAHWTIIYQSADIVIFLFMSVMPLYAGVSITQCTLGLTVIGVVTSLAGLTFESLQSDGETLTTSEVIEAIAAVPKQFAGDARAGLLAPFVFGFGITTAMFAYYVNADVVSSNLGTATLGYLEAFSYFVAVVAAYPYAYVSNKFISGQDWVVQFGSLSFLMSGFVVFLLTNKQLGTWQNILIVKGLYGLGRGVFEGSCRAKYAELFTGKDLSTAFSGQTLCAGFSGGICFFMFGVLQKADISMITVVNGVVAILAYSIMMSGIDVKKPLSWGHVIKYFALCERQGAEGGDSSRDKSLSRGATSITRDHSNSSSGSGNRNVLISSEDSLRQSLL